MLQPGSSVAAWRKMLDTASPENCPFVAGLSRAEAATIRVHGRPRAGRPLVINITARTARGQRLDVGGDSFEVALVSDTARVAAQAVDHGDGTHTATLVPPREMTGRDARLRVTQAYPAIAHALMVWRAVRDANRSFASAVVKTPDHRELMCSVRRARRANDRGRHGGLTELFAQGTLESSSGAERRVSDANATAAVACDVFREVGGPQQPLSMWCFVRNEETCRNVSTHAVASERWIRPRNNAAGPKGEWAPSAVLPAVSFRVLDDAGPLLHRVRRALLSCCIGRERSMPTVWVEAAEQAHRHASSASVGRRACTAADVLRTQEGYWAVARSGGVTSWEWKYHACELTPAACRPATEARVLRLGDSTLGQWHKLKRPGRPNVQASGTATPPSHLPALEGAFHSFPIMTTRGLYFASTALALARPEIRAPLTLAGFEAAFLERAAGEAVPPRLIAISFVHHWVTLPLASFHEAMVRLAEALEALRARRPDVIVLYKTGHALATDTLTPITPEAGMGFDLNLRKALYDAVALEVLPDWVIELDVWSMTRSDPFPPIVHKDLALVSAQTAIAREVLDDGACRAAAAHTGHSK
ncbi:hypothetical protein EMIHUDRAFT_117522 [Emiliania huxleyi CCMP1516]|uniref:NXPE C-terminal domain-containing protein n=2 Tax=Emiliania huxleyi TaxID=2903 RepID=A0A0D3JB24_EMIH1|nr:hypothetical protein EMIHUDRAFT_117522 [Emiliania huxleyi CCMP1516]EOD20709.1 hypothetical protein EMIHUDRAFT_117522 [Emiliania huxleyi CCMP1516]|eukprot:XP_005773138.1 hypothetical protein EMIHUDRAFT_117522 [Emiliania huxleyi CCMP1516]